MSNITKRIKFILKFRKSIPFLKEYYLSKEVSIFKKVVPIILIIAYILIPIDIIPDFFAFFGFTDDVVFTSFLLQNMVKYSPESLKRKYDIQ